ncbi:MAG: hypothetical protein K5685_00105 [Bacteroidales bacterium]|nr:hypothetical protein [Bacteroidales bacterium]
MRHTFLIFLFSLFASCFDAESDLEIALDLAGENRAELEKVLAHYKNDPEKLAAAKFLIENMPYHYSYRTNEIEKYYDKALKIFASDLTPAKQRDSLLKIQKQFYPDLGRQTIPDIKIMTADYLIYSVDYAFENRKTKPYAKTLSFDEFCEWLLPYKVAERQSFDFWRDTLKEKFSEDLKKLIVDDEEYGTAFKTLETVRKELFRKIKPAGMHTGVPYPMLNAATMSRQTFGRCIDYVNLGVATIRSLGLPVIIDETPLWGRYRAGHSWYTMLSDRGEELHSEWDISTTAGGAFFPYQRIPKIFRNTFSANKERIIYRKNSLLKLPFDYCKLDVTDKYFKVSNLEIPSKNPVKNAEDYAYIFCFNGHNGDWSVVDFGTFDGKKAIFKNMGRNILYLVQYFDGEKLRPLNSPFILHSDGQIEFINFDNSQTREITVRRKYFQNANVAEMRQRILGAKIQASDFKDFSKCEDLFEVSDVKIPDKISVTPSKPYRYYRYLSSNGSYGSIAELAFFDTDTLQISGKPFGNSEAVKNAFDDNYLTNFETENPDGNFVGMEFSKPEKVSFVRIIPRSDDNDIHFGQEYELRFFDGEKWVVLEKQIAKDNFLKFKNVPKTCLLWLKNLSAGWDERVFLIKEGGKVEWW